MLEMKSKHRNLNLNKWSSTLAKDADRISELEDTQNAGGGVEMF